MLNSIIFSAYPPSASGSSPLFIGCRFALRLTIRFSFSKYLVGYIDLMFKNLVVHNISSL
jgi:hypothetical protein